MFFAPSPNVLTAVWKERSQDRDTFKVSFNLIGVPVIGNFIGRAAQIEQMEKHLQPIGEARRQTTLVLHGLGGIGKTQLALEFVKRHRDEYSAIFWISGKTEQTLRQGIADIAKRIPLENVLDIEGELLEGDKTISVAIRDVSEWLRAKDNFRWLLILDNIDSQTFTGTQRDVGDSRVVASQKVDYDIRPYFEPLGQGSILITTRLSYMA